MYRKITRQIRSVVLIGLLVGGLLYGVLGTGVFFLAFAITMVVVLLSLSIPAQLGAGVPAKLE